MWWLERSDRLKVEKERVSYQTLYAQYLELSKDLLTNIKENTTATVKLLERLKSRGHETN